MPLPEDPKLVETSNSILDAFKGIFGSHPGFRPAHAKGALLTGTFTPTPQASLLSSAPHFNHPSTPILARFSSSTGIPILPDTDPNGQPRGLAIRFQLPPDPSTNRRRHTDIITHAVDAFPAATPEETLAFFSAVRDGQIAEHVASHPNALTFVQIPKPFPVGFGREKYFAVNAFKFVNGSSAGTGGGKETYIRYRITPVKGTSYLSETDLKEKSPSYLFEELADSISSGDPIEFILSAQIADLSKGDVTNDNTAKWPEEREIVELGRIKLEKLLDKEESERLSKEIIFDPIPRVEGVEASDDPLLELRAGVYLLSGRERRAA
ncbi:Catalase-like domain containing protein [Naviculisporaceae sp. PSN 640]